MTDNKWLDEKQSLHSTLHSKTPWERRPHRTLPLRGRLREALAPEAALLPWGNLTQSPQPHLTTHTVRTEHSKGLLLAAWTVQQGAEATRAPRSTQPTQIKRQYHPPKRQRRYRSPKRPLLPHIGANAPFSSTADTIPNNSSASILNATLRPALSKSKLLKPGMPSLPPPVTQ